MLDEMLDMVASGEATVIRNDGENDAAVAFAHDASLSVALRLIRASSFSQWVVTDFALRSNEADGGLTGKGIRALPLGEMVHQARVILKPPTAHASGKLAKLSDTALGGFKHKKARERDDRDFAELALEYVMRLQEGDRSPAMSLAEGFGGSANTWSNRLLEARNRGLLTKVGRGEAGGMLTEKSHEILFGNDLE